MFKKLLLVLGALFISTNLSFAQDNCHPLAEIQNAMKQDHSRVVATMTNKNLGTMALITDSDGDWYIIYFKGDKEICFAAGGNNLTFAPPPPAPSQDVAK